MKDKVCDKCGRDLPLDQFVSSLFQGKKQQNFLKYIKDRCKDCDKKYYNGCFTKGEK